VLAWAWALGNLIPMSTLSQVTWLPLPYHHSITSMSVLDIYVRYRRIFHWLFGEGSDIFLENL
jgi:hypothetical protein